MRTSNAFGCVVVTSLLVACGSGSEDAPEGNGGLRDTIVGSANDPLPPEKPLTDSPAPAPDNAIVPAAAVCKWRRSSGLQHYTDFAMFDPNSSAIWAGNVIQSKSLPSGIPEPIRLPRAKGKITITGLQAFSAPSGGSTYSREVPVPDLAGYQDSLSEILNGSTFGTPGVWTYTIQSAYSQREALYRLGLAGSFGGKVSFSASLGKSSREMKNSFVMKFVQRYFTVSFAAPERPEQFFTPDVTADRARAFMSRNNAPAYISEVTYGRQLYVKVETNYSQSTIRAALALSIGKEKTVEQDAAASKDKTCPTFDNSKCAKVCYVNSDVEIKVGVACAPKPVNGSKPCVANDAGTACGAQPTKSCNTKDEVSCFTTTKEVPSSASVCEEMRKDPSCKGSGGGPTSVCLQLSGSACVNKVLQESTLEAWGIGGSAGGGGRIALSDPSQYYQQLADYIDQGSEFSQKSPGAPISYKVRALADNKLLAFADPLDFMVPDCVVGARQVDAVLEQVTLDDLQGASSRPSTLAICLSQDPDPAKSTCNSQAQYSKISEPFDYSLGALSANRITNGGSITGQDLLKGNSYFWLSQGERPRVQENVSFAQGGMMRLMATVDLANDWQTFDTTLEYSPATDGDFGWRASGASLKVLDPSTGLIEVKGKTKSKLASDDPGADQRGSAANVARFRLTSQGQPIRFLTQ